MITVHGIPNCDTVKRARAWLDAAGLTHQFHDFKKLGVPAEALSAWCDALGWEKVLNRQGTTWRKLDPAQQVTAVDAASACKLMSEHPSLIKRPVVQWGDGQLSVGFKAEDWQARQSA